MYFDAPMLLKQMTICTKVIYKNKQIFLKCRMKVILAFTCISNFAMTILKTIQMSNHTFHFKCHFLENLLIAAFSTIS